MACLVKIYTQIFSFPYIFEFEIGSTIEKRCRKFSVLKLGPCSEIAANVNLLEGNLLIFMKIIYFTWLATFICRDWPEGILKLFWVQLTFLY